ncbi:hypothetical protein PtrM4_080890 [Pyrenophora tritici-repentis]|uniref:Uncharacterized protein n=1 Tax=Pyrenophora tritici-repentis TaxID=45151 RepID=A0A317ABW5_9PLEO|nr:hypothetical protein PtrM4_080890 [Pyrenophora tritici-repentis]
MTAAHVPLPQQASAIEVKLSRIQQWQNTWLEATIPPLLQLPRELRDEIYAYVFTPPPALYYGRLESHSTTRPRYKLFTTADAAADAIYHDQAMLQHTCRQLRQETLASLAKRDVRIVFHSSRCGSNGSITAERMFLDFMKYHFQHLPLQAYCFDLYLEQRSSPLHYPLMDPNQDLCSLIECCHRHPAMRINAYLESSAPEQLCSLLVRLTLALRGTDVSSIIPTTDDPTSIVFGYPIVYKKFASERTLEWRNVTNLRVWPIFKSNEINATVQFPFHDNEEALALIDKWYEEGI